MKTIVRNVHPGAMASDLMAQGGDVFETGKENYSISQVLKIESHFIQAKEIQ